MLPYYVVVLQRGMKDVRVVRGTFDMSGYYLVMIQMEIQMKCVKRSGEERQVQK